MVQHRCEVAIVGGGLAGYATALGMAQAGFDTILLAPPPSRQDTRTTALLGRSVAFLSEIGLFPCILDRGEAIKTIRIIDDSKRLLRGPLLEFRAEEIDLRVFGYNVRNADLLSAAQERAATLSGLQILNEPAASLHHDDKSATLTLENGDSVVASLVVGADGQRSLVREQSAIRFLTWSYPQSAIVLNFSHAVPHQHASNEFHASAGPLAQVPLPGMASSLVWVEQPHLADLYVDLKPERLAQMVEERLHSLLGAVTVDGPVARFPLRGGSTVRVTGGRAALVGEAGHVFPPIGAQGLNLGLRDAGAIVAAASANRLDPGRRPSLRRYELARRADILSRTLGVDVLNRSLLADFVPTQLVRAAGLSALSAFAPIKRMAMREGLFPGAGFIGLPRSVRDAIGGRAS
ncbi:UbiH/UbiF family hydroxylase [Consotaella aegiceratis]|uniref:UbiH/UbiF family hydroxylase n=1 Tax=Consotaella aegiceratis TaxID=3097961 RepID=UPI002F4000A7